jgi:hypothetical protein
MRFLNGFLKQILSSIITRHVQNVSQKQGLGLSKVKNTGDGKKARAPSSGYIRYLAEERRFYGE